MVSRTTVWTGGLTIAVGLWVLLWESRWDSTDQAAIKAGYLTLWDEGAVTGLRISVPAGELEIERRPEGWMIIRPLEDEADPERMNRLVRQLCRLPLLERLEWAEVEGEEFGFSPSNQIGVEFLGEGSSLGKVFLGRDGPFEKTVYARMEDPSGRRAAGLASLEIRDWLASPLAQLRDRRLLRIPLGAITGYRLRTEAGEIVLRRDLREPRWRIESPLQTRANDDIVFALIEELSRMTAEEFRDDQALPVTASMDGRSAIFRLEVGRRGEPVEIVLRQEDDGRNPGASEYLLAKRSGRRVVLRVKDDLVRRLPKNVNQLRYPYLAEVPVDAVARIELRSRLDPDVVLMNQEGEWKLEYRAELWPANEARIEKLLAGLNAEPVVEFRASTGAQSADHGLDQPLLSLTVTTVRPREEETERAPGGGGGGEGEAMKMELRTETLRFGQGPDAFLNANFEGEPFIFAVDPSFVHGHLPSHPLKWRGLRLFEFRLLDLREIAVEEEGGAESVLFYNYLRNEWSGLVNGERVDDEINVRLAEGLAYHLGSLTVVDWLTERREALRTLQRPSCRVRFKLATGETGGEDGGTVERGMRLAPAVTEDRISFYYGQMEGDPDVFLLRAESYERLVSSVLQQEL